MPALRRLPAQILHHGIQLGLVPPLINCEPKTASLVNHGGAQRGTPLANAAREDEGVDLALEGDKVRADKAGDAVDKQVKGESRVGCVAGRDGSKVGRARQGGPARLFVEDLFGLGDVQVGGRGRG